MDFIVCSNLIRLLFICGGNKVLIIDKNYYVLGFASIHLFQDLFNCIIIAPEFIQLMTINLRLQPQETVWSKGKNSDTRHAVFIIVSMLKNYPERIKEVMSCFIISNSLCIVW